MQPMPVPVPQKRGFPTWAIVLLSVVVVVVVFGGILVTLAIYGMRKYIANAKTAEARNSLGQIAKDAAAAYEREDEDAPLGSSGTTHRLCPSASRSVPTSISAVSGKKYQSSPSDWEADAPKHAGFACLEFEMDAPQYYMYSYASTPTSMTASAKGDLNGDGVTSNFTVRAEVRSSGALYVDPNLEEVNPQE